MLCDKLLDRPAMLVAAAVAVGAEGRDLAVVLQESERHLPRGWRGTLYDQPGFLSQQGGFCHDGHNQR